MTVEMVFEQNKKLEEMYQTLIAPYKLLEHITRPYVQLQQLVASLTPTQETCEAIHRHMVEGLNQRCMDIQSDISERIQDSFASDEPPAEEEEFKPLVVKGFAED